MLAAIQLLFLGLLNAAAIRDCDLREVSDLFELTAEPIGSYSLTDRLESYRQKSIEHTAKIKV